jgi:hypothetical protein
MKNFAQRAGARRTGLLAVAIAACVVAADSTTQVSAQGLGRGRSNLTGTYRLNTSLSDNTSTLADQVTRSMPGRERPRLRNQILQRLDAPEQLAIERNGRTITMASSNADRVTFEADGRPQTEPLNNGRQMRTVASLTGDRLEVNSSGDRSMDYQLTFEPLNGGRSLRVTRRVSDAGLNQPVVARSVYDRVSTDARLDMYSNDTWRNSNDRFGRARNGGYRTDRTGAGATASEIADGTTIVATLDNRLSTREARAEDPFTMTVVSPAQFQGARIDGRLLSVDRAGRVAGRADLTFDFDRVRFRNGRTSDFDGTIESVKTPDGDVLRVENTGNVADEDSQTSRTATRTGIGAAIGAVLGAVTGGTKGAAIGAAIGGAAGAGSVIVQGRDDLNLEPGTEFQIRSLGLR